MSDNPYPVRPAAPARQSQRGEHLWTFLRCTDQRRAELRDHGPAGVELQWFVNGEFTTGYRVETRALALAQAASVREAYELDGWICSRCHGERWTCDLHPERPAQHDTTCPGSATPCRDCNTSEPPRPRQRITPDAHLSD